jgi:hypothetical protein
MLWVDAYVVALGMFVALWEFIHFRSQHLIELITWVPQVPIHLGEMRRTITGGAEGN